MNFSNIGTLGTHVKNMGLEWKWNQRKDSNDFTSKGSTNTTINNWLEEKIAKEKEEAAQMGQKRDKTMETIQAKLYSGQKLTADEERYLQEKDPQAYQKMKSNQMAQKSYEESLKKCKTKEDVERLKMSQMAQSFSAVNTIMHDPAIPEEKKLELVMQEHQKVKLIETSTQEFVESGRYHKLPTEAEKRKAEKDLEEAKEAEREEVQDSEKTDTEKTPEEAENTKNEVEKGDSLPKEAAGTQAAPADGEEKPKMTRIEAEQTPEAQKVRRAKAQRAYWENNFEAADAAIASALRQIEVKA